MKKAPLFVIILLALICGLFACEKQNQTTANENAPSCQTDAENQLKIVAQITLKPNAMESMRPVFEKVIAGSQAEEGCIYYDLHKEVSDSTNTKYVMLEIWKDQAAIDLHNESQHFKTFVQTASDYLEGLNITVLKVAK